jgi:site-specific DNA-cytosine methylase
MKIAVLFDGAGLARLGLEQAGHSCVGVEVDPVKHYLGSMVGLGNSVLMDVRDFDLSGFDAVWASPPCQTRSNAKTQGSPNRVGLHSREYSEKLAEDLVPWSLSLSRPLFCGLRTS